MSAAALSPLNIPPIFAKLPVTDIVDGFRLHLVFNVNIPVEPPVDLT